MRERVRPPREQSEVKRRASGRGLQVWLLLASGAGGAPGMIGYSDSAGRGLGDEARQAQCAVPD